MNIFENCTEVSSMNKLMPGASVARIITLIELVLIFWCTLMILPGIYFVWMFKAPRSEATKKADVYKPWWKSSGPSRIAGAVVQVDADAAQEGGGDTVWV